MMEKSFFSFRFSDVKSCINHRTKVRRFSPSNFGAKKAQLRQYPVLIVIVILFLAIVLLFWNRAAVAQYIDTVLPNYGFANQSSEQTQILRYNILEDKIEWFDGTKFNTFANGVVKFRNNRALNENQVRTDFFNFYFSNSVPLQKKSYPLPSNLEVGKNLYPEQFKVENFDENRVYNLKQNVTNRLNLYLNGEYTKIFIVQNIYVFYDQAPNPNLQIGTIENGKINLNSASILTETLPKKTSEDIHGKSYNDLLGKRIFYSTGETYPEFCVTADREHIFFVQQGATLDLSKMENGNCVNNNLKSGSTSPPSVFGDFQNDGSGMPVGEDSFGMFRVILQGVEAVSFNELQTYENGKTLSPQAKDLTKTNPAIAAEILDIAKDWRDQILKTPITIHFSENDGPLEQSYCAQKYDGKYLVIDLNKPQTQC